MKIRILIILLLLGFLSIQGFSQSDKKIKQCIEVFDNDPLEGIKKLKKLIDKAGKEARIDAWEIYVEMYETIYNTDLEQGMTPFEMEMIHQDLSYFNKLKKDFEAKGEYQNPDYLIVLDRLEELNFAVSNPGFYASYETYIKLSDVCREASLKSKSIRADANLRTMYLTFDPDTMTVDSTDLANYGEAYTLISSNKLKEGKVLLDSVYKKYPDSYNINMSYYLYYYYGEQMDSAKIWLKKCIDLYPKQIEPRENLAKILFSEGNIYRAKEQIEEMMVLFPGQDMKNYYTEVLFVEDKMMQEKRLIRPVFPNQIGVEYPAIKGHWADYQNAKAKVSNFSDAAGIIRNNDITKEKYLELYSWKRMLEKNRDKKPEELLFAYEMEEKGLLDCYVFYSNYHLDFALQAQDFVSTEENRERMKQFVRDYLVVLAR